MSEAATAAGHDQTHAPAFGDRERAALEFERLHWVHRGTRDQAIRDRFGMSSTRYTQWVLRIIDMPEALIWDPQTVHRLQRLRDRRRGVRQARYGGSG